MKKNRKLESKILRNNNYLNTIRNFRANTSNLSKIKYDVSKASNIINEYNKLSKSKINSDAKLNKTNSLYNRANTVNKNKNSVNEKILFNKKKLNNNKIKNNNNNIYIKNQNISSKQNNIYNDDSEHSSMETIRKILYSTDNKKEAKKDNLNSKILKSSKINNYPNINKIFNNLKIVNQNEEKKITSIEHNINNNNNSKKSDIIQIDSYNKKKNFTNGNKIIDKNLLNRINKELNLNPKRLALQSMKFIKTNNNYDFDNNDNSINLTDEFDNIREENNNISNNKIFNQNNNNYTYRKINNNINININNNNIKNIKKKFNNKIQNLKISNKNQLTNNNLPNKYIDIDENFLDSNDNNSVEKSDEIFILQEKIKELKEEINNKNILINEYSTLAKKSKLKFEQLIIHNKKVIQELKNDNNKQLLIYKSKIVKIEKERQNIMNKYLENKKYNDFLEGILFNKNEDNEINNINNLDEKRKIKYLEEIIKKLLNNISKIKIELENKNKENEKLKNIIIKYKDNKSYRAISNPRKNTNIFDEDKNIRLIMKNIKNGNDNKNKNKDLSTNISLTSKNFFNKINISKNE